MTSFERILFQPASQDAGIATITLNRPEKRNAIDGLLIRELREALAVSTGARVIALQAAGADFCSGADLSALKAIRDAGVLENREDARQLADLFQDIRKHPRPVVALVRGRALAGGCGLATACDVVLAAESAQFGYPEIGIGFAPAIVMAILRRSVPEKRAFEMVTMGTVLTAQQAASTGLITRAIDDNEFDAESEKYLRKLASQPPAAAMLCKELLYRMDGLDFAAAIAAGVDGNAIARMTGDCKAGIDRFLNRQQS